ncbi:MAG: ABC transporter permease subunit, partial [Clostridiales Family XIII bacterium]|nr:ABC transporter permease subunit [Clostridiales Family XIII bacterium]
MNLDYGFLWATFLKALRGLGVTFELTAVALLVGIPFGFVIAIVNIRKTPILHQFFRLFISFMRSTPAVVQIFIAYFGLPKLLIAITDALGMDVNVYDIPPIFYAFTVFSLIEISCLAEVFRAALS